MSGARVASQVAVVAAIVAALLCVPLAALGALIAYAFSLPLLAVATFGGTFSLPLGLAAWWLACFAVALVYAVVAFPWKEKVLAWPRKS